MELRDYVRVLRNHALGVALLTIIGVALAAVYTFSQAKVYAADSTGFVSAGSGSDQALASVNDTLAKSRALSYVDIATSRPVAQRVIDDLDLSTDPGNLIRDITVDQPTDTVLIKITAKSSSPQQAQDLANAWVNALADQVESIEDPSGNVVGATKVVPVESAELPTAPVSPRPPLNLAAGLVLGLLLGFAYAVLRSQLDRRLRSGDDIEKRFAVAVVGQVPAARKLEASSASTPIDAANRTDVDSWGASEGFRKIRTNLAFMDVDEPPRIIVVTSPQSGDGKSTIAANLASAIAQSGQAVTLIDGDLRRPTVATSFGLAEGAGLTDVLIHRADIDDIIQDHDRIDGLSILAAGSIPPNPSELLASKAMQGLLNELARKGMVIIDAPPLLPVTDAAVLTRHSDGAIIVIGHGKTLDTELSNSLAALNTVNSRVLGIVFNRVPRNNSYGGYYGGYYQATATGRRRRDKGRGGS